MKLVYLDYAATTPPDRRVIEKMHQCLVSDVLYGNASSQHVFGRQAAEIIELARQQVATLIGALPREIIWTSGATESNNLAIKGATSFYQKHGKHIVTCKTEHKAVLDTCQYLQKQGYEVSYLDPEPSGLIDHEKLIAAIRDDTILISIMHVNNEIGIIQDIQAIGEVARSKGILFHVDAAQSAGKIPINLQQLPVDFMSLSAHKLYGPKGVGALYVRRKPRARLIAQLQGGGQEQGLRSGTLATHQLAGMGEAFAIAALEMPQESQRVKTLRDKLWLGLQALQPQLNGDMSSSVSGILNVSFADVDGEALLVALKNLAVSSGSACVAAAIEPSHVLRAIGRRSDLAHAAIRFSIGRFTTMDEIEYAIIETCQAVRRLRACHI